MMKKWRVGLTGLLALTGLLLTAVGARRVVENEWDAAVGELKKCAEGLTEGSFRKSLEKTVDQLKSATMGDRFKGFRSLTGIKMGSLKADEKMAVEEAVNKVVRASGRLISDVIMAEKKSDRKTAIDLLQWLLENKREIDHKPLLEFLGKDDYIARSVGASYFESTLHPDGLPELIKAAEKEKDPKALEAELKAINAYANKVGQGGNLDAIKKFIETLKKLSAKMSNDASRKIVDQEIGLMTMAMHRAECRCVKRGKPNEEEPAKTMTCPWCDCVSEGKEKAACDGGAPNRPCKCHK